MVNPQQALDLAAEKYGDNAIDQDSFIAGEDISFSVLAIERAFLAGALSPEAMRYWEMNSPAVLKLVEALQEIVETRGRSISRGPRRVAYEALKAWDEREK